MKKINILIFTVLFAGIAMGQEIKRETIKKSASRVGVKLDYNQEWYQTQKKLWKEEVEKNPKSEEAWLNYYHATFYGDHPNYDQDSLKYPWGNNNWYEQVYLDSYGKNASAMKIVNEMEKYIPKTFTFYYCKSNQLGKNQGAENYMIKAYEMQPENPLTYHKLILYYEMKGDLLKRREVVNKLYKNGNFSFGSLNYCYNLLMTVDKGGVLLTRSWYNSSFLMWILQDVFNVRSEVVHLNEIMLFDSTYRDVILNRLNIKLSDLEREKISPETDLQRKTQILAQKTLEFYDFRGFDLFYFAPSYFATQSIIQIALEKSKKKFYVSPYAKGFVGRFENLYNVGLLLQYSKEDIDNIALIRRNFRKRYKLDYIETGFYNKEYEHFGLTYVSGLLTIFQHAKESEDIEEMEWSKRLLEKIVEKILEKESEGAGEWWGEQKEKIYKVLNQ